MRWQKMWTYWDLCDPSVYLSEDVLWLCLQAQVTIETALFILGKSQLLATSPAKHMPADPERKHWEKNDDLSTVKSRWSHPCSRMGHARMNLVLRTQLTWMVSSWWGRTDKQSCSRNSTTGPLILQWLDFGLHRQLQTDSRAWGTCWFSVASHRITCFNTTEGLLTFLMMLHSFLLLLLLLHSVCLYYTLDLFWCNFNPLLWQLKIPSSGSIP